MRLKCIVIYIVLFVSNLYGQKSTFKQSNVDQPRHVELKNNDGVYRLYVDDEPFFIKGAGIQLDKMEELAAAGANSFRTWNTSFEGHSGKQILDKAHENGLMVLMCLEVGRERHGFDYEDTAWVSKQYLSLKEEVLQLKNHPALLAWGIGNELNMHYSNIKVWDAVNDIARMIHEVDGHHPTTTMFAGISKIEMDSVISRCPHLDFVSIQSYADIENLEMRLTNAGYKGPYLVTEWGATGHWEVAMTEWGAPIEPTSTEKAEAIKRRYVNVIQKDSTNCLGSFAFYWGQKQERTPTWYGFYSEEDEKMEAIDALYYCWNKEWPENRAPKIVSGLLNGMDRYSNVMIENGKFCNASIEYKDLDDDEVSITIEILPESKDLGDGGDIETRPESLMVDYEIKDNKISFRAPEHKGAYRLFFYIKDANGSVGTINIPFKVI